MRSDYLGALGTIEETENQKEKIKQDIQFLEEKLDFLIETSKYDPLLLDTAAPEEEESAPVETEADGNKIMISLPPEAAPL